MRDEHISDTDRVEMAEAGESLGFLLRIAQVQAFANFHDQLGKIGIKPGEFTLLWAIYHNPGQKQGNIARTLRIKPAHMTKLVGRQVDQGLVTRDIPADDRRSVRLTLTKEGEDYVTSRRDAFLDLTSTESDTLSTEDARTLVELLKKFTGQNACR